jgi:TolB-like protein
MNSGTSKSRLRRILVLGREHLTHWVIAGAILALTGFAPEHWVADLLNHLAIPESVRDGWLLRAIDLRIVLVAVGVAIIAWDVLRRSNLQKQIEIHDNQAGDAATAAFTDKPSIAVLPFQNMSGDPEQEYFADGMVEEIITGLSRIKWLLVISRNSSFIYKNKPVAVKEVADKLGVRYVLEGGVRKAGNRVRITAQLIDAKTGAHLWAEQYDRLLEDVFAMQDEITMCVIGAIEPNLRKAEIDRIKRQRPSNLNAYDLVLRSLPFCFRPDAEGSREGDSAA